MEAINKTYKYLGLALVILGIIDLFVIWWMIINNASYVSFISVFGIIIGIGLLHDSTTTARIGRWLCLFYISYACLNLLIYPFNLPFDLTMLLFKVNSSNILQTFLMSLVPFLVILAVYKVLSNRESLLAIESAGYKTSTPKTAIYAAIVLLAATFVPAKIMLSGNDAAFAEKLAQEKFGGKYKYYAMNIAYKSNKTSSTVIVYNENSATLHRVEW